MTWYATTVIICDSLSSSRTLNFCLLIHLNHLPNFCLVFQCWQLHSTYFYWPISDKGLPHLRLKLLHLFAQNLGSKSGQWLIYMYSALRVPFPFLSAPLWEVRYILYPFREGYIMISQCHFTFYGTSLKIHVCTQVKVAHTAGVYPGFHSTRSIVIIIAPLRWDASSSQVIPQLLDRLPGILNGYW